MKKRLLTLSLAVFSLIVLPLANGLALAADKTGSFRSNGSYKVSGKVTVKSDGTIRLRGFRTSSGPDLYVYVGNGSPSTLVARLKRNSGNQNYKISAALAKSISTVHIHCKKYSSLFGTARVR